MATKTGKRKREEEAEKEQTFLKLPDAFTCSCEHGNATLEESVSGWEQQIPKVNFAIETVKASITQLKAELKQLRELEPDSPKITRFGWSWFQGGPH